MEDIFSILHSYTTNKSGKQRGAKHRAEQRAQRALNGDAGEN